MVDIHIVMVKISRILDNGDHYDYAPATPRQVRAVNIFFRNALGDHAKQNDNRYELMKHLFILPETPTSTKKLTKGQASALIFLSRHETYSYDLNDLIDDIIEKEIQ